MTSTAASTTVRDSSPATVGAEQLTLLPSLASSAVSPRFRLSRDTRERGLRHVAEIRRMLADRRSVDVHTLPVRHDRAA